VLLAFGLNLHALTSDSFWGDEILTALYAGRSPAEVIAWTAEDIHPPLYYLLAGAFTRLIIPLGPSAGPDVVSDWLWRFPSALAAVLSVAVTYRLAARPLPHAPHTTATFAALLLTLAPVAIKYGQEARMHALFMLLAALSTWFFFLAVRRPARWRRWLVYGLALSAMLYTMYFGFLILAAHGAYWLSDMIQTKVWTPRETHPRPTLHVPYPLAGFSGAVTLAFLLYTPWWPVLFNILRRRAAVGAIEGGVGDPLTFVLGVVEALGPAPLWVAWLFLALFGVGLVWLARQSRPLAVFATAWLLLPVALPLILGDPRALQFRYAFVLPVYLTVITYGLTVLGQAIEPQRVAVSSYLVWILATLSFLGTLDLYQQTKPDWRAAAAYLDDRTRPTDLILTGPLWDEGRFIDYYYRGQAQLLTPAALVTNIERHAAALRDYGGRIWAVNRFSPTESPVLQNVAFEGVVVSEPRLPVYEPELLSQAAIDLAAQAVEAAYPWAAAMEAEGVLNPDPRTAQAAALRALGDTLMAAGRPAEALVSYQRAVDIFPGWVSGFVALAEAQQAAGNLPAAVEAYRQAVVFNAEWHGPAAEEANSLAQSGQWETALQKYRQIIGD
jgi:tetratricopeptide (TPR) repeat protein